MIEKLKVRSVRENTPLHRKNDTHAVLSFYDRLGYAADDVRFLGEGPILDE